MILNLKSVLLLYLCWTLFSCAKNPETVINENPRVTQVDQSLPDSSQIKINSPAPFVLKKPQAKLRFPLKSKKIKVLALHSINSFFLYDGEEHGLEYELLQLYAKHADFAIDIVTVENYKQMYDSIAHGNFDMVMGTLFVNAAMDSITPFSKPLYHSDVILATATLGKNENVFSHSAFNVIHHSPIHFWIQNNDSIFQGVKDSLRHLEMELSKEVALERVAHKEFKSLLVDRHEFLIMHSYFPQLTEQVVVQRSQPVAFAFNPHAEALKDHFNAWHTKNRQSANYAYTLKKYDDHSVFIKEKLKYEMPVIRKGIISKYDPLIRQYAQKESLDWKLVAAIIQQESRFRPHIVSPVGAYGLMQLMPSVAKTYKTSFSKLSSPDLNIALGTKYFRWIYNHFDKPEFTDEDKIKFSLASYNAGIGHVHDARALAQKYKLNPNVWTDNVEVMLLNKSARKYYSDPVVKHGHCRGFETRVYVRNIMQYYEHYQNFRPVEN
jgi:membrane-bound lytic murein transglycosylase F